VGQKLTYYPIVRMFDMSGALRHCGHTCSLPPSLQSVRTKMCSHLPVSPTFPTFDKHFPFQPMTFREQGMVEHSPGRLT
jgi:hypothetical protein